MALYESQTKPLRRNSGAQNMIVSLGTGSVVFEVEVENGSWVTDTTVTEDGKISVDTTDVNVRMVVAGNAKVNWN